MTAQDKGKRWTLERKGDDDGTGRPHYEKRRGADPTWPWMDMRVGDALILYDHTTYTLAKRSAYNVGRTRGIRFRMRQVDESKWRIERIE